MSALRITLGPGEVLFEQGDRGDCAYVVEFGRIRISARRHGLETVLNEVGPGEMFGELALIDEGARTATAKAVGDAALTVITRQQIAERVSRADPVLGLLLREAMRHLRREIEDEPTPINALSPTIDRMRLEGELAAALEREELELWYQPVVDLTDRRIAGFEALLRWRHPTRGLIPPVDFIPLAEESGLIVSIGAWVLDEACRGLQRLESVSGDPRLFMCVNVSGRQLEATGFSGMVLNKLDEMQIAAGRLRLEVTEGLLITSAGARDALHYCKSAGAALLLDDFGTGYSSLAYLNQLPFDGIKIDRSFAAKLTEGGDGLKLVRAMLGLAESLGRGVVMEGVETGGQVAMLRELGCRLCQGYYFARPSTISEAERVFSVSESLPWG